MEDISTPITLSSNNNASLRSAWKLNMQPAVCDQCDWTFLLPAESPLPLCPHCFQANLTPFDENVAPLPSTFGQPPELVLPVTVAAAQLTQAIQNFARGIWFAPADLTPANLQARLQQLYLPLWLIDSETQAVWQAEAGFDYQVVSHQDAYDQNRGGWVSREVTETRVRWEPRLGRLERAYRNIVAPALEEHAQLQQKMGDYDLQPAQPYRPELIAGSLIRLPNRPPTDAWPEAMPALRAAAARECQRACQADHLRDFRWQADYTNQNWTLLLLPLFTTYYLDDDRAIQPLLIHGQSGRLHGPRRASLRRAQQIALIIVATAAVLFGLSLLVAAAGLLLPALLIAAGIGLVLAIVVGLLAVTPIVMAWHFNRTAAARAS